MKNLNWQNYRNTQGDFELPKYVFDVLMDLMKKSLDMGTLLSNDQAKLRAYKEQIKNSFKSEWLNLARALESFQIITPCECDPSSYCRECGGSRYALNRAMSPDEMREIAVVVGTGADAELTHRLNEGLQKALHETSFYELPAV